MRYGVKNSEKDSEIANTCNRIRVAASQNGPEKRIWDKQNSCLYCEQLQTNLRRHLFRKHSGEMDIAKILSKPSKSKERANGLEKIRNLGNFYHNAKVRELGEGTFLVVKRPTKEKVVTFKDYVPCVHCKGYYMGIEIWRHYRECNFKDHLTTDDDECKKIQSVGTLKASRILGETTISSIKENPALFAVMKSDEVSEVCKSDKIITSLGCQLSQKKGNSSETQNYIRAKMREIARLLLRVREVSKNQSLNMKDILKPEMFDTIIDAIGIECKYSVNNKIPKFEVPSLALKIGHSLRKCAYMKIGLCIKERDEGGENECEKFLKLLTMEYTDRVSSIALQTLSTNKRKTCPCLPLTEDVMKFQSFVQNEVSSLIKDVCNTEGCCDFSLKFQSLAKATLARVITFNKRRSGEVARMLISDFTERQKEGNGIQDISEMLCPSEQKLMSRLELMTIIGKRGRSVPVILTKEQTEALAELTDKRQRMKAGISPANMFAFPMNGARGSHEHIRGYAALNDMVCKADLTEPKAFKSTALRKYVATVSQVLNMNENEMDWLASHLGHDIRVHRHFYRLQSEHVELAKVAKLLIAVDSGNAHRFAGKTIENMEIADLDDVEIENEDREESDDEVDESVTSDTQRDERSEDVVEGTSFSTDARAKLSKDGTPRDKSSEDVVEAGTSSSTEARAKLSKGGKKCEHRPWSQEEKRFILEEFRSNIIRKTVTGIGKKRCEEVKVKSKNLLEKRTWIQIKSCVKNLISKNVKEENRHYNI
ncbi:uncharacterized protein [Argopecten irradians]|uniref:uncharacterized protein n=1 Tax=Argopecten irradians TaxID=31199 RepID=UPI0037174211